MMCTLTIDDHSLQMTRLPQLYDSFVFGHVR